MPHRILKLGNPALYEVSHPVKPDELNEIRPVIQELHNLLFEFKAKYNAGRAIAAPQIGYMKRLIYMNIDKPVIIINPKIYDESSETFELWDDCMCFPELLVKVKRHKSCKMKFYDEHWQEQNWDLTDDMSELLQHEVDHLDGILATDRAIDSRSFRWKQ
ncbi:MAG: peptide deformylase [Ignavibacteriae bacterium]|nr:MAG: peptide deformylase [Ignavibacteriota bacterium]